MINTRGKATLKYNIHEFTPYIQEFAKIDAVSNICTQIATEHNLVYGKDFAVGEMGIAEDGVQWVKIDFQKEEIAVLVRLRGLTTFKGITK